MKKNVCNASAPALTWQVEGHFPSEPVFIPCQIADGDGEEQIDEDDGVVTMSCGMVLEKRIISRCSMPRR